MPPSPPNHSTIGHVSAFSGYHRHHQHHSLQKRFIVPSICHVRHQHHPHQHTIQKRFMSSLQPTHSHVDHAPSSVTCHSHQQHSLKKHLLFLCLVIMSDINIIPIDKPFRNVSCLLHNLLIISCTFFCDMAVIAIINSPFRNVSCLNQQVSILVVSLLFLGVVLLNCDQSHL